MHQDWPGLAAGLSARLKQLRSGAPDVMKGFAALDTRTKGQLALGIAVATRCDACVAFHAEAAVSYGATRDEVLETMGMAIDMGPDPRSCKPQEPSKCTVKHAVRFYHYRAIVLSL